MAGPQSLEILDVSEDEEVSFRAGEFDPPNNRINEAWYVDDSDRVSQSGNTVTVEATIKPEDDFLDPSDQPRLLIKAPSTGILSFSEAFFGDITEQDELVLRLSVKGASDTVSATTSLDTVSEQAEVPASEQEGGTLDWDTNSVQLQCGATVTSRDGDMNMRVVYHAVCTLEQLRTLQAMRESGGRLKLVSHGYSGWLEPDQLKWDRVPDANGVVTPQGSTDQPIYEIQLQQKEQDAPE